MIATMDFSAAYGRETCNLKKGQQFEGSKEFEKQLAKQGLLASKPKTAAKAKKESETNGR